MKRGFNLGVIILFIVSISFVVASGDHGETFEQAEEIIKAKIDCSELTNEQLEILGDYYMEQMHPRELHEIMDERMGGEGSESLRLMHIRMGGGFYCGKHGAFSGGMMDVMMGRGMMGDYRGGADSVYYREDRIFGKGFAGLIFMVLIVVVVFLIILLVKQSKEKNIIKRRK